MKPNIKVEFPDNFNQLITDAAIEAVKTQGVEIECPKCKTKFKTKGESFQCPHCNQSFHINF